MINGQHIALNHMKKPVKLCMSIGTKMALLRRHGLTELNRLCLQQEDPMLYLKTFISWQTEEPSTISQIVLENKNIALGKVQGLGKKLAKAQDKAIKHKKIMAFVSTPRMNQNQDTIYSK